MLILAVLLTHVSGTAPHPSERAALERLYTENGGATWVSSKGWMSAADVCGWEFVECDGNGFVTSLLLVRNKVSGVLVEPAFWNNLTHAGQIDLSSNLLTGNATAALRTLPPSVFVLNLADNSYTGSVNMGTGDVTCPPTRSADTPLTIYLGDNAFTEAFPPVMVLPACVQKLDIGSNKLTALPTLSPALSSQLAYLYLDDNSLVAADNWVETLCPYARLQALNVANNPGLAGSLPSCVGSLKLSELTVTNTAMSGTLPSSFAQMISLVSLTLSHSAFSGTIPDIFANMQFLKTVVLENGFVGGMPASLFNFNRTLVSLQHNSLTGTVPAIPTSVGVTQLLLTDNKLSGVIDPSIWSQVTQQIVLSHNAFVGTLPSPELAARAADSSLELVTFFNNAGLGGIPLDFYGSYADIPWLQNADIRKSFFWGLDLLKPLPAWAAQLGAAGAGRTLGIRGVEPALVPNDVASTLLIRGSLADFPAQGGHAGLFVGFCVKDGTADCTGDPLQWTIPRVRPEVLNASVFSVVLPASAVGGNVLGSLSVAVVYENANGNHTVSNTHNGTVVYADHPVISSAAKEDGSLVLRYQGCERIYISGADFANTTENVCRLSTDDNEPEDRSIAPGPTNQTLVFPAVYHNATHMTCVVPFETFHPQLYAKYMLRLSPNSGRTWSANRTSDPFIFTDYCPLQSIKGHPFAVPCDAGCDMCPCSSSGECRRPLTPTEQPKCACDIGAVGDNCALCADGYFGEQCALCRNCGHGECNAGRNGDGSCVCDGAYSGETCGALQPVIAVVISLLVISVVCVSAFFLRKWYRNKVFHRLRDRVVKRRVQYGSF